MDEPRELGARLRVTHEHARIGGADQLDDLVQPVVAHHVARDVVLAVQRAIERDLDPLRQRRASRQRRAPEVHGAIAGAIARPGIAAHLHRASPVLALALVAEQQRLAGSAARLLRDHVMRPYRGQARGAVGEIRAAQHGQLGEVARVADVVGRDRARLEDPAVQRHVVIRVAHEPLQRAGLQRGQLVERSPLGRLELAVVRHHGAAADVRLPRRLQHAPEHRAIDIAGRWPRRDRARGLRTRAGVDDRGEARGAAARVVKLVERDDAHRVAARADDLRDVRRRGAPDHGVTDRHDVEPERERVARGHHGDRANARRALEPRHRSGRERALADDRAAIGQHGERHVEVVEPRIGELERRHGDVELALEPRDGVRPRSFTLPEEQRATAREHHRIAPLPVRCAVVVDHLEPELLVHAGASAALRVALGAAQAREHGAPVGAARDEHRGVLREHAVVRTVDERQLDDGGAGDLERGHVRGVLLDGALEGHRADRHVRVDRPRDLVAALGAACVLVARDLADEDGGAHATPSSRRYRSKQRCPASRRISAPSAIANRHAGSAATSGPITSRFQLSECLRSSVAWSA